MGVFDRFKRKARPSPRHAVPTVGQEDRGATPSEVVTVLEWSRELARGRILHPQHGALTIDASVVDANDLDIGQEVAARVVDQRVVAVHPFADQGAPSTTIRAEVVPAGIFQLGDHTPEEHQRLGEALEGASFGHHATIDFYPSFITLAGFETALTNDAVWHEVESRMATFLDHHFGFDHDLAAVWQGLTGDLRQVQATVEKLERQGPPARPFFRLYAISVRVPVNWRAMAAEDEKALHKALAELPSSVGLIDRTPRWYGSGASLYPRLWATRDEGELRIGGMLPLRAWKQWFAAFERLARQLPRMLPG